jgi:tetratricopeptide (TPR) repeat protein
MNKKFLFLIILTSFTVFVSVRYTADLKKFYIETWYLHIKKITPETALKKCKAMYKKKEYPELMDYCTDMMMLYPENREIRGIAGMTSLKLGNHLAGAQLLLSSIENPLDNPALFKRVIVILFKEKNYGDITAALSEYPVHHDTGLLYIYGVSLLRLGDIQKGLRYLQQSEERGNINYEVYYYLGFAHDRLGNTEKARGHLEEALRLNPLDNETRKLLVATYSKLKQYKKAELLLRRGM